MMNLARIVLKVLKLQPPANYQQTFSGRFTLNIRTSRKLAEANRLDPRPYNFSTLASMITSKPDSSGCLVPRGLSSPVTGIQYERAAKP